LNTEFGFLRTAKRFGDSSLKTLSKKEIISAFKELSKQLGTPETPFELFIVGGAALVLLYDARETTKDVDIVQCDSAVRDASLKVAVQLNLPADWLNDGAKGYVHGMTQGEVIFRTPTLIVRALAQPQLLAMKLSAWRDDLDIEDARLLLSKMHTDKENVWRQIEPYLVPGRELKARYAFEDLWESEYGTE
jgi:hypothetical protein